MVPPNAKYAIPYETKPGDTLWGIDERFYGDEDLWPLLGQANRIDDPNGLGKIKLMLPRDLDGARIKLERLDIPTHRFKLRSIPPRRVSTLLFDVVLTWGGELWVVPVGRRTDRKSAKELVEQLVEDITVDIFPERMHALVTCELIRQAQAQGMDRRMDDVRNGRVGLIFERRPRAIYLKVDDWIIGGTFGCLGGTRSHQDAAATGHAAGAVPPPVDTLPAA